VGEASPGRPALGISSSDPETSWAAIPGMLVTMESFMGVVPHSLWNGLRPLLPSPTFGSSFRRGCCEAYLLPDSNAQSEEAALRYCLR
jgi:hypothetical protein